MSLKDRRYRAIRPQRGDVLVESGTQRRIGFGVRKVRLARIHRRHPGIGGRNFDLDPLQLAVLLCHDARRISVDGRIDPSRFEVLVQIDDVWVEVEARAHQLPQILDIEEALNRTHLLSEQVPYGCEARLRIDRALIGVYWRRQADDLCTGRGSIPIADRDVRAVRGHAFNRCGSGDRCPLHLKAFQFGDLLDDVTVYTFDLSGAAEARVGRV